MISDWKWFFWFVRQRAKGTHPFTRGFSNPIHDAPVCKQVKIKLLSVERTSYRNSCAGLNCSHGQFVIEFVSVQYFDMNLHTESTEVCSIWSQSGYQSTLVSYSASTFSVQSFDFYHCFWKPIVTCWYYDVRSWGGYKWEGERNGDSTRAPTGPTPAFCHTSAKQYSGSSFESCSSDPAEPATRWTWEYTRIEGSETN